MLEVRNLTKTFGSFTALQALNMTIPKGAIYGLVGPNGAGKTTLIRHITGVYRPDCGEIALDGEAVWENPDAKGKIGFIPDDLFFFHSSTIEDMRRYYKGLYPRFDDALFEKLGEAFDLPRKSPIRKFSKGMKKQAAFWLTVACRPELLVLDEPVDGLDPVMRRHGEGPVRGRRPRGAADPPPDRHGPSDHTGPARHRRRSRGGILPGRAALLRGLAPVLGGNLYLRTGRC